MHKAFNYLICNKMHLNCTSCLRRSPCFALAATFDGKQHLLSLPVVNSIDYVLRFLKKLCRSLHCENLFSDQPITQHSGGSYQSDGMYTFFLFSRSFCAAINRLFVLILNLE